MVDTPRTRAALLTLYADNTSGAITPQNLRDGVVSWMLADGGVAHPPQGRLTLATATPVMTSDQAAKTTIYYTPYVGNTIPIYDGTCWLMMSFAELSNITSNSATGKAGPAVVANNSNYDLFVWNNAGTLTLTRGPAWTSDTARGTGAGTTQLTLTNGIYLNTVAITNGPGAGLGTYVGTVRSNGSAQIDWKLGSSAAGGGAAILGVWNMNNRVMVSPLVVDSTASWTYSTATIRPADNSSGNRISFVRGMDEDSIRVTYSIDTQPTNAANAFVVIYAGGLDSTTAQAVSPIRATQVLFLNTQSTGGLRNILTSIASGLPGLGFHYMQALELGDGATTSTFRGSAGALYEGAFLQ